MLATISAVFWLVVSDGARAQETCAAAADPAFAALDDTAAQTTITDTLSRGELVCAGSLLRARHAVLVDRTERAATIARLGLRDLALSMLREARYSAEQRLALVIAATTPSGVRNLTTADSRADSKLLKLVAVQMLSEQAYDVWLGALAAWLRVSPRSDADVQALLVLNHREEPFVALWKSGGSERLLAFMRQLAGEPNLAQLRITLGRAFFHADECNNDSDAPSVTMVVRCRDQLRNFREIEALGCWGCPQGPGMPEMTFEAASVLFRYGAIIESGLAFERAIAMLSALPPQARSAAVKNVATRLQRMGYNPARVAALLEEAETLRLGQTRPSFPSAQ